MALPSSSMDPSKLPVCPTATTRTLTVDGYSKLDGSGVLLKELEAVDEMEGVLV
jgi:hypothetical protein